MFFVPNESACSEHVVPADVNEQLGSRRWTNVRTFSDISVPVEFSGNEIIPNLSRNRRQTDDSAAEEPVADIPDSLELTEGSGSTDEGETDPDPEGSSAGIMKASSAILGFILARIFA